MGGNDSLCIPSSSTSHEDTSENGERNLFGHPHCTVLESHPFFPVLLSLLVGPAVRIPIRKDLFIQPHSRLSHPKPEIYNLHAWLCCREVSRRQDFLRNLPRESVLRSDLPHFLSVFLQDQNFWGSLMTLCLKIWGHWQI